MVRGTAGLVGINPLIAPEEFYNLYGDSGLMPTKPVPEPDHPWFEAQRAWLASIR